MKSNERQTRSVLMELFESHGFRPRTHLGQNFLIDINLVEYIVTQARLTEDDVVLEIGAGTGGMTMFLAESAAAVVSVEVDHNMHQLAQQVVESLDNVTLLRCDALKNKNNFAPEVIETVQAKLDEDPNRRLKLVANLPYSIATPVVSNLVASDLPWMRMIITIQLELAKRMTAKPGTSSFGSLPAWLQSQCDTKLLKRLPPTVFWPRPKVNSGIVRLSPNPTRRRQIDDRPFYQDFLRRLFHQRRKLMRSVLVGMYRKQLKKSDIDAALASLNISNQARAEQIEVQQLVELANQLHKTIKATDN